jgi:hypothetical protein
LGVPGDIDLFATVNGTSDNLILASANHSESASNDASWSFFFTADK